MDNQASLMQTHDFFVVNVGILQVNITRTDEGVVVDIWPNHEDAQEPLTSTYAFFTEGEPEENEDGQ